MGDIPYFTPPEQTNTCFYTTMQETSTNLVWAHLKSVQYCFNVLNGVKPCYLKHKLFLHLENIKHSCQQCQHSKILKVFRSTAKAFGLHLGTLSTTQLVSNFFTNVHRCTTSLPESTQKNGEWFSEQQKALHICTMNHILREN